MVSSHSSESTFRKQLCSVELKVFSRQVHWLPTNKQRIIVWLMPDRHSKWLPSLLSLSSFLKHPSPSPAPYSTTHCLWGIHCLKISVSHTCFNSFQTATQQLSVIALSSSLGIMSKEKSAVGLFFWLDGHTGRKINWASVFLWNPIFHYVLFDTPRAALIRIGPL